MEHFGFCHTWAILAFLSQIWRGRAAPVVMETSARGHGCLLGSVSLFVVVDSAVITRHFVDDIGRRE